MFFLRITLFIIAILGFLTYIISTKIRSQFFSIHGKPQPLFRSKSSDYKAFCKNPPTQYIARRLALKRKLLVALIVAVVAFLLAILSVAL